MEMVIHGCNIYCAVKSQDKFNYVIEPSSTLILQLYTIEILKRNPSIPS